MDHSYLFKLLNIPDDSIIINDIEIIPDTINVYSTTCSTYAIEDFPFFQRYKQSSDITPILDLEAKKDFDCSTTSMLDYSTCLILKFMIFLLLTSIYHV